MTDEPTLGEFLIHDDRVLGMLNDPGITGFLLNVGIALARLVDFEPDEQQWKIATILGWLFPCPPTVHGPHHQIESTRRLVRILRSDLADPSTGAPNPNARLPRHFPELDWPAFLTMLPVVKPATAAPSRKVQSELYTGPPEPHSVTSTGLLLRVIDGGGEGGPAPAGLPALSLAATNVATTPQDTGDAAS